MNRPYFTFFKSYYEAVIELDDEKAQLEFLLAICSYSLTKIEPAFESKVARALFTAIRPTIDANIKQYENGSKPKTSQPKAKDKPTESQPLTNKDKDKDKDKDNKYIIGRFAPPTLDEVKAYMSEKGVMDPKEAEKFIDFYSCKGWMVGKNKMKDWQAAVRNWIKGMDKKPATKQNRFNDFQQRNYDYGELEKMLIANG